MGLDIYCLWPGGDHMPTASFFIFLTRDLNWYCDLLKILISGAASASYKTFLRRRPPPPPLQKSALVKAQIVFYLFVCCHKKKQTGENNQLQWLYPWILVRVLLVFLLYILSRTGEAKRNPLKKIHSFASDLRSFLWSYLRFVDKSLLIFSLFCIFSKFLAVLCLPMTWAILWIRQLFRI